MTARMNHPGLIIATQASPGAVAFARIVAALTHFTDEAVELVKALAMPSRVVREAEMMGELLAQARRLENTQPRRAANLRRRASMIGLRI